jgi:hypothetical protein
MRGALLQSELHLSTGCTRGRLWFAGLWFYGHSVMSTGSVLMLYLCVMQWQLSNITTLMLCWLSAGHSGAERNQLFEPRHSSSAYSTGWLVIPLVITCRLHRVLCALWAASRAQGKLCTCLSERSVLPYLISTAARLCYLLWLLRHPGSCEAS